MKFLKHHIIIIVVAAVASVGIISYAIWGISGSNGFAVVTVSRMTIQEEVHGTGNVKAAEAVDLAFERGGTIARVYAQTGDLVTVGQSIIAENASDLIAQLAQADADMKTQQAKLDELKRGARPEDIANQNITVTNAETALGDANRGMIDKLEDAYTKADDAVRGKADQMFSNPQTENPQAVFSSIDAQTKTDLEWQRSRIEYSLKKWAASLEALSANDDFTAILNDSKQNLEQIKSFLVKLSLTINNPTNCVIDSKGACQPIASSWKTDIGTARANVNTAESNLTLAEASLNTAKSSLATAKQGLVIKEAGTAPEQIAAQEAQLERSQASKSLIQSQLNKSVLRSPLNGVISRQDGKVGAIASPNVPLVSVISNSKYQIEIYVSEADVAKIISGQAAKVTLDAYGENELFDASVIKVDPAAVLIGGVNAYKVTLQFANDDTRIKAGMGANVEISTASHEGTLAVPKSALVIRKGDTVVLVPRGGAAPEERIVKVGIKGTNGYVEILSGLKEQERVTTFGGTK